MSVKSSGDESCQLKGGGDNVTAAGNDVVPGAEGWPCCTTQELNSQPLILESSD